MPYLCNVLRICDLMDNSITSLFRSVYGTHQKNAGMSAIPRAVENSDTFTCCDSFMYFRWIHCLVLYFQRTRIFHLHVVLRCFFWTHRVMIKVLDFSKAVTLSFQKSTIASIKDVKNPSESTWVSMFSAIMLALNSLILPSGNSTSYKIVLRIGLSSYLSTVEPDGPTAHFTTVPVCISSTNWSWASAWIKLL